MAAPQMQMCRMRPQDAESEEEATQDAPGPPLLSQPASIQERSAPASSQLGVQSGIRHMDNEDLRDQLLHRQQMVMQCARAAPAGDAARQMPPATHWGQGAGRILKCKETAR
jgi:hypothetical protein